MQRLRSLHPEDNFTQIPNVAMDDLPDLNSLGLLNHVLRHRDDFVWDLKKLVASKSGVGQQAVSKARDTLIRHGYYISVKFQHSYRGQFATDIYRSSTPHTEDDLALLHERYRPGSPAQIVYKTENGFPRDKFGNVMMRDVVIRWAEITSFRGVEVVASAEPEREPEPEPDDSGQGPDSQAEEASQPGYGNPHPGPRSENPDLGEAAQPGYGNPDLGSPDLGSPDAGAPSPGEPDPYKKTGGEQQEEDHGEQQEEHEWAAAQTPPEFGCHKENGGHSESVVAKQGDQVGNPLHAREGKPDVTCENTSEDESSSGTMTREEAQAAINARLAEARSKGRKRASTAA